MRVIRSPRLLVILALSVLIACAKPLTLYKFPENAVSKFDPGLVEIERISDEDINADFSNCDDLNFLLPAVKDRRLVLLGETHYFARVRNIINRLIFSLKKGADFSFISLEAPYSISPFINYYIHLSDDSEAHQFYESELQNFIHARSLKTFLDHSRQWNKQYPDNQIDIGAHDIEYNLEAVRDCILIPFFKSLYDASGDSVDLSEVHDVKVLLELLLKRLPEARPGTPVGRYPFITPDYIKSVLDNIQATNLANQGKFFARRQKRIIKNLTDDKLLGSYLRRGKSILYGGGQHMRTKGAFKKSAYYWEGEYFNNLDPWSKNKCLSISVSGVAFNLKKISQSGKRDSLGYPSYFDNIQDALKQRSITGSQKNSTYYALDNFNDFRKMLVSSAERISANCFRINQIDYDGLKRELRTKPIAAYPAIARELTYLKSFDVNLYVLKSEIWQVMEKID